MEPEAGAWCDGPAVRFRLIDSDRRLSRVRLSSTVLPTAEFTWSAGSWTAGATRPAVHRIEYRYELTHPDGRVETVCDPDNPRRAPGGYGDNSELWCEGYREPDWLDLPPAPGAWRDLHLPLPAVHGGAVARIWSPEHAAGRVVVAHDGPDFDAYGRLGRYTAAMIGAGRIPPYHLVLLPPGDRFEWYSANPAYARALNEVLGPLTTGLGATAVVGVGSSLGALAMLHAQRRHPRRFTALFLQSGSFFQPRFDRQEAGFRRYLRIVRFVGRVLRDPAGPAIPATLTCGAVEENLANNRDMARALGDQGYPVTFAEVPDAHHWAGWRDALDPHLTTLLRKVF